MSGARGTNVVPMMPQGQMMPMPMSSFPAGCCPPGGDMNALLQCYCDVQAATAFISKVVTDLAANDPAFQKALVDGIVASGSNIPLIGVTNGSWAQPGQVGEFIEYIVDPIPILATVQDQNVTMGTLQPGDWDCWANVGLYVPVGSVYCAITPIPPGLSPGGLLADEGSVSAPSQALNTLILTNARITTAVPVLINFRLVTNNLAAGTAGNLNLVFCARRRR